MAIDVAWLRKRLTQVYETERISGGPPAGSLHQTRQLEKLRLILFSDLHKGQRDGADDFKRCETVYMTALDHYWEKGFELFLLGDIEELWECRPHEVVENYRNVLAAEQRFAEAANPTRYLRFAGNHDDLWYTPNQVKRYLGPFLGASIIEEGLRIQVQSKGKDLGELFLIHGHQGTLTSDRYRKISSWLVRNIWRPIQRFLDFPYTTPSNNFELRKQHEKAIYDWAADAKGPVLIAGHTHHPVWQGLSLEQALAADGPDDREFAEDIFDFLDVEIGDRERERIELPGEAPYYFNTGCCSYSDGSITGLEIQSGEIRLVRWENPNSPQRQQLFKASLADVFDAVAKAAQA